MSAEVEAGDCEAAHPESGHLRRLIVRVRLEGRDEPLELLLPFVRAAPVPDALDPRRRRHHHPRRPLPSLETPSLQRASQRARAPQLPTERVRRERSLFQTLGNVHDDPVARVIVVVVVSLAGEFEGGHADAGGAEGLLAPRLLLGTGRRLVSLVPILFRGVVRSFLLLIIILQALQQKHNRRRVLTHQVRERVLRAPRAFPSGPQQRRERGRYPPPSPRGHRAAATLANANLIPASASPLVDPSPLTASVTDDPTLARRSFRGPGLDSRASHRRRRALLLLHLVQ
mmetsp:Transcript_7828/g.34531  ORF Transcript_7828/g.34531 Transcript_7828/m.34531 type:complete len:286 (+) Transcript_7828:48-905(+)